MRSFLLRHIGCYSAILVISQVSLSPALAGSLSGTVNVSLNVSAACAVNGGTATTGSLGQLGDITFTAQPGIFGDVDAVLVPSAGVEGISVLCSPGLAPALTIGSGANDTDNLRHMASGEHAVAYRLFTDAARTNEIAIGQQISLGTATSTAFTQPIYARTNSGGRVLAAGTYVDTVQVTLSW